MQYWLEPQDIMALGHEFDFLTPLPDPVELYLGRNALLLWSKTQGPSSALHAKCSKFEAAV